MISFYIIQVPVWRWTTNPDSWANIEGRWRLKIEQQKLGLIDVSTLDLTPEDALVVGYVESCVDHEDSDHYVTMTRQVTLKYYKSSVRAPNAKQDKAVAKPGTVMPSGADHLGRHYAVLQVMNALFSVN